MKRAFLATLWIGALAAAFAVTLQMSGLLARPASWLHQVIGLPPDGAVGFGNLLLVIGLGFAVAWALLQVPEAIRRGALVIFLVADLLGAAWLFKSAGSFFPPLPAIVATIIAALLVFVLDFTRSGRRRQETARLFAGRLAQPGLDRLTESTGLDLSEPATREASFVFCEIANQADLIDELPAAVCAQQDAWAEARKAECCPVAFTKKHGYLKTVLALEQIGKNGNRPGGLIIVRVLADEKYDVKFFILQGQLIIRGQCIEH